MVKKMDLPTKRTKKSILIRKITYDLTEYFSKIVGYFKNMFILLIKY